jgi:ABC-type dipeptide/oligopeptide/nickel transport system permease component
MIHIVPGDPVEQMLGEATAPGPAAQLRHALGLDLRPHFNTAATCGSLRTAISAIR